jgi:tripartite-type tricarboxylate transporter receptor subunit TctC
VVQKFAELGSVPVSPERATPEALRARLKTEIDKWGPMIRRAGIYAE